MAVVTHSGAYTRPRLALARNGPPALAGDAFITTRQESAYAAITQAPEMHGPPMYFTPDWVSACASVQNLAALSPDVVVTGHGQAMQGLEMRAALHELAERFDEIAVPKSGRYALK
jgi:hypothetical protein